MENHTDIFIIGGGINGTAIAADGAGRGLSVVLCEQDDLGHATSSKSTKLIHGGLRYLEYFEFNLVKAALKEREILLKRAPHLIFPLEFILPYEKHLRPAWLLRLGLWLYDHLATRTFLPRSKKINLKTDDRGIALLPHLRIGFSYYDCMTDDARLVILNALSAKENGATILTRHQFLSAEREKSYWKITLKNRLNNEIVHYQATALVNAAGPWVEEMSHHIKNTSLTVSINTVKGSHIIIPKLYEGNFAYILQNSDQRVVFVIPYLDDFTLVGTTDIACLDVKEQVTISQEETLYLIKIINQYFQKKIKKSDIIWTYSGIRCLQASDQDSPAAITRDYKLLFDAKNSPALIHVIGGKITTHRTLAEEVIKKLQPLFPLLKKPWTSLHPLPGGDIQNYDFHQFLNTLFHDFSYLPPSLIKRYAKNYGTRTYELLKNVKSIIDLGEHFAHQLYEREVLYLVNHEWARTSEDILWRRTKLGLLFSNEQIQLLTRWLKNHLLFIANENEE